MSKTKTSSESHVDSKSTEIAQTTTNSETKSEVESATDKRIRRDTEFLEIESEVNVSLKPGGVYQETENGKPVRTISVTGDGTVNIKTTTKNSSQKQEIERKTNLKQAARKTQVTDSLSKKDKSLISNASIKYGSETKNKQIQAYTIFGLPYWIWILLIVIFVIIRFRKKIIGWVLFRLNKKS